MKTRKLKENLSLNKEDKIEISQALRDNISEEYPSELSKEQLEFIKERLRRIDNGEIKLKDWDDVKKRYKRFE